MGRGDDAPEGSTGDAAATEGAASPVPAAAAATPATAPAAAVEPAAPEPPKPEPAHIQAAKRRKRIGNHAVFCFIGFYEILDLGCRIFG